VGRMRRQRLERRAVLLVGSRRQGAQRASVIATLGRNKVRSSGGDARELDRGLDGFRSRIREEGARQPGWSDLRDLAQEFRADVAVEALMPGGEGLQLFVECSGVLTIGVAEDRHAI